MAHMVFGSDEPVGKLVPQDKVATTSHGPRCE
jgi:hypothetical protein